MIDGGTIDALTKIAERTQDLLSAFQAGFEPHTSDVAATGVRAQPTPDPLSAAAPLGAYFVVSGQGGERTYTRAGAFHVADGTLRAADGRAVLGYAPGGTALQPLGVDPVDRALGHIADERIESDGSLVATRTTIDPRRGERRTERVTIGRVALARFPAGTVPVRVDGTHVVAPAGVSPHVGTPADGAFAPLSTHARDTGRVDFNRGLMRLQEAYLALDALQAAHRVRGAAEKTTMDLVK